MTTFEPTLQTPMRILMTIHHPLDPNSGASGSLWQLMQEYRDLGHEVETYSFDDLPARWPEQAQMLLFPWATAWRLARRAASGQIDLIDAHTGDSWVWSTFLQPLSRRARSVVLITRSSGLEHAAARERIADFRAGRLRLSRLYFLYHGGFRLWEVARSLRHSQGCIFLNGADRDLALGLGVRAAKTLVSGNGVPAAFAALPLEDFAGEPPRIAIVGTFAARKGIAYSVPALQRLLENHPALEVGFFGVGVPAAQVLEGFSPAARARIRVVETFAHDDLPELLRPYGFQLLASLSEGFGKVLLEGMARGLACVTSDAPGPLEIARDGENALVVPRRSSAAIVAGFERLLGDPELTLRLREQAQITAKNHTWAAIARARLDFYDRVRGARKLK